MILLKPLYIKAAKIFKKIKMAEEKNCPIYISAPLACGKTAAIEYYYRNKKYRKLSGESGYLDEMPEIHCLRESTLVIDDISWITDTTSQQYIIQIVNQCDEYQIHIVLAGRSRFPSWLRIGLTSQQFIFADEQDLCFSDKEVKKAFDTYGILLDDDDRKIIEKDTKGYPLAISCLCNLMKQGDAYNEVIKKQMYHDIFLYLEHSFYDKLDGEMCEVLMALCRYEVFTVELAEILTGSSQIQELFEQAMQKGCFLKRLDDTTYTYREMLRKYFQWKQDSIYTEEQRNENYARAALYYEIHNQIEQALNCYSLAGKEENVSKLLIKNAMQHPGTAHFFETKEYYYDLPPELVCNSPILMSGLSILYSMTLQSEKSDEWYQELKKYEQQSKRGSKENKEAKVWIAYLDIALPHRGIHGIIRTLKNTAILMKNKEFSIPELSVTSNLPSIMNGGLDFCEWSRNDRELGILMKKPVEMVLGKYGVGLVNIALAESGMENGSMNSYEIMTRLNAGYLMSETGGKIEMCFAATGLLVREHLKNGQTTIAKQQLERFRVKAVKEDAKQLFMSIETMRMWIGLLEGDVRHAREWLETAPDELHNFYILYRYQYINKVRCFICLGKNIEALSLIEILNVYFENYERNYLWIENQVLKAIALFREQIDSWEEVLDKAMSKAERYHFTRIFAREGIALVPLLEKFKRKEGGVTSSFYEEIVNESKKVASFYPSYLKTTNSLQVSLTKSEQKILKLLMRGISSKEICDLCFISYSGFKFHCKNIYKKLGVNSRQEAVVAAKDIEIE